VTEVFADARYFLALVGSDDADNARAFAASREAKRRGSRLVTTAWVLTEVGDALASPAARPAFLRVVAAVRADPRFVVVPPTQALFDAGLAFFQSRPDKEWSFTDCISFVVMAERGIKEALTGDRHFDQASFKALLK
jgi:predicted nucleic acid-binding protein